MEILFWLVVAGIACAIYRSGIRTGSRRGFAAGRYGRNRRLRG